MAAGTTRPGATHGSSGYWTTGYSTCWSRLVPRTATPDGAGVVGHARSGDLVDWEVLPPLTEPGEFAQVEVPQLVRVQGGHTILFSCHAEDHSSQRVKRLGADGQGGTFALRAKHFSGPMSPATPLSHPSTLAWVSFTRESSSKVTLASGILWPSAATQTLISSEKLRAHSPSNKVRMASSW